MRADRETKMSLPDRPRVIYSKNPLDEVVCQFRVERLLEIDTELPADFQSMLKADYPSLSIRNVFEIGTDGGGASHRRIFDFASADLHWKVSLASDFIALSSRQYTDWSDFRRRLAIVLGAFTDRYQPAFFTRIGLRYRDVIIREKLGLDGVPWRELLKPQIAGVLLSGEIAEGDLINSRSFFSYRASADLTAQVQHGLGDGPGRETAYVIDMDFFMEGRHGGSPDTGLALLDRFRPHPRNLFQWCISDPLHYAMEPGPIQPD